MSDPVWFSELERAFREKRNGKMDDNPSVELARQVMSTYQSYIQVGFTPDQAMKLVCEAIYAVSVATICKKK